MDVCTRVCGQHMRDVAHVCGGQRTLQKSVIFLPCAGPRDQTQIIMLASKHFYSLSHLTSPLLVYIFFLFLRELHVSQSQYVPRMTLNLILLLLE